MTAEQRDDLLNDSTHAVATEFKGAGVTLSNDSLYRLNDLLTAFFNELAIEVTE